jgi:hypothetical protein
MSPGSGNASKAQIERRRETRYRFDAAVEIEWGSTTFLGRVRDISRGGMFLTTPETLWIGAGFLAKLLLDPPIHVDCTVRRAEPGRGIGVQMSIPEQGHQAQLQELLTRLESKR